MNDHPHYFCTFHVDNLFLAIDAQEVQEVIRCQQMTRVPLATSSISGLINLRGQIVTAIDLRSRFGMPVRDSNILPVNVVVRDAENAVSLLVDRISDVVEMDDEQFEPLPSTVRANVRSLIRGAYKLRDRLVLVLDIGKVLAQDDSHNVKNLRPVG